MPIDLDTQCFRADLSHQPIPIAVPIEPFVERTEGELLSFVELVLAASECSEDESEVRDLVDALFESDQISLRELRDDQIPCA